MESAARLPRGLLPWVYGTTSTHAVRDRPEPRALPARQEVHLALPRRQAEDVPAILARVNHEDHGRVD